MVTTEDAAQVVLNACEALPRAKTPEGREHHVAYACGFIDATVLAGTLKRKDATLLRDDLHKTLALQD